MIKTRIDQARVAGHTQFWLEKASGVAAADDDQDHVAEGTHTPSR
jgi:hypothetical protein